MPQRGLKLKEIPYQMPSESLPYHPQVHVLTAYKELRNRKLKWTQEPSLVRPQVRSES